MAPAAARPVMSFASRDMRADDLAAVVSIEAVSFDSPWTSEMFADELVQELSWTAVSVDSGGEVVGFLIGRRYPDVWHLMDLAVSPAHRRLGVGGDLLGRFLGAADAARMTVILEVRQGNAEAMALYEGRGFVTIGQRRGYYTDTHEDALVMARKAGDGGSARGPAAGGAGAAPASVPRPNSRRTPSAGGHFPDLCSPSRLLATIRRRRCSRRTGRCSRRWSTRRMPSTSATAAWCRKWPAGRTWSA